MCRTKSCLLKLQRTCHTTPKAPYIYLRIAGVSTCLESWGMRKTASHAHSSLGHPLFVFVSYIVYRTTSTCTLHYTYTIVHFNWTSFILVEPSAYTDGCIEQRVTCSIHACKLSIYVQLSNCTYSAPIRVIACLFFSQPQQWKPSRSGLVQVAWFLLSKPKFYLTGLASGYYELGEREKFIPARLHFFT